MASDGDMRVVMEAIVDISQALKSINQLVQVGNSTKITPSMNPNVITKDLNDINGRFQIFFQRVTFEFRNFETILAKRFAFSIATAMERVVVRSIMLIPEAFKEAIKVGMEFQTVMYKVATIVSNNSSGLITFADAMITMGGAARQIGADTVFTAVEVAEAMSTFVVAGFDAAESISGVTVASDFAIASQTSLKASTEIITQIMKSFGTSLADLPHVVDTLTLAINTTSLDVPRLTAGFRMAAPAAGAFGVSLDETMFVLGKFTDVTKQGGIAGRAFRFMLQTLIAPGDKARETLESIGLKVSDLSPRFNTLESIFKTLRDSSGLTVDVVAEVFGARTSGPIFGFIQRMRSAVGEEREMFKNWADLVAANQGLAAQQAEMFQSSLTNQWKITISKMTEISLVLFDMIEPALRTAVRALNEFLTVFIKYKDFIGIAAAAYTLYLIPAIFRATVMAWELVPVLTALVVEELALAAATKKAAAYAMEQAAGLVVNSAAMVANAATVTTLTASIAANKATTVAAGGKVTVFAGILRLLSPIISGISSAFTVVNALWLAAAVAIAFVGSAVLSGIKDSAAYTLVLEALGAVLGWLTTVITDFGTEVWNWLGGIWTRIADATRSGMDTLTSLVAQSLLGYGELFRKLSERAALFSTAASEQLMEFAETADAMSRHITDTMNSAVRNAENAARALEKFTTVSDVISDQILNEQDLLRATELVYESLGDQMAGFTEDMEASENPMLNYQEHLRLIGLAASKFEGGLEAVGQRVPHLLELLTAMQAALAAQADVVNTEANAALEKYIEKLDKMQKSLGMIDVKEVQEEMGAFWDIINRMVESGGKFSLSVGTAMSDALVKLGNEIRDSGSPRTQELLGVLDLLIERTWDYTDQTESVTIPIMTDLTTAHEMQQLTVQKGVTNLQLMVDKSREFFGIMSPSEVDSTIGNMTMQLVVLSGQFKTMTDDTMKAIIAKFFEMREAIKLGASPEQIAQYDKLVDLFRSRFPEAVGLSGEKFDEFLKTFVGGVEEVTVESVKFFDEFKKGIAKALADVILNSENFGAAFKKSMKAIFVVQFTSVLEDFGRAFNKKFKELTEETKVTSVDLGLFLEGIFVDMAVKSESSFGSFFKSLGSGLDALWKKLGTIESAVAGGLGAAFGGWKEIAMGAVVSVASAMAKEGALGAAIAAAGVAVGILTKLFAGLTDAEKVTIEAARRGLEISAKLADQIGEKIKEYGDAIAAVLMSLIEVVEEQGIISMQSINTYARNALSIFSLVEQGIVTAKEGLEKFLEVTLLLITESRNFGDSFGQVYLNILDFINRANTGLINTTDYLIGMADILNGLVSVAFSGGALKIQEFFSVVNEVIKQVGSGFITVNEGIDLLTSSIDAVIQNIGLFGAAGADVLRLLQAQARAVGMEFRQISDYFVSLAEIIVSGVENFLKPINDQIKAQKDLLDDYLADIQQQYEDEKISLEELASLSEAAYARYDAAIAGVIPTKKEFMFATRAIMVAFNELRASGMSIIDIYAKIGDSVNTLREWFKKWKTEVTSDPDYLGIKSMFAGNEKLLASFDKFFGYFRKLGKEAVQEVLTQLDGLSQAFQAMGSLGMLTFQDITMFANITKESFAALTGEGLTHKQALASIVPQLAALRDMALQYGYSLDVATQEMINQAEAFGMMPPVVEPVEAILGDIRTILALIAEAFGVTLPDAMKTGVLGMDPWFGRMEGSAIGWLAVWRESGKDVNSVFDFAARAAEDMGKFTRADFRATAEEMGLSTEDTKKFVQDAMKAQRIAYREAEREKRKEQKQTEKDALEAGRHLRDELIGYFDLIRISGVGAFRALADAGITAAEDILAAWAPVATTMYGQSILPDIRDIGTDAFEKVGAAGGESASLINSSWDKGVLSPLSDLISRPAQASPVFNLPQINQSGTDAGLLNEIRLLRRSMTGKNSDQKFQLYIGGRELKNFMAKSVRDESVDGRGAIDSSSVRRLDS